MNLNLPLLLASNSPRRQELLKMLGYTFEVQVKNTEESFPVELPVNQVAEFIANKKAEAFTKAELNNKILITADTVVCLQQQILGKPGSLPEASEMLAKLSGNTHQVITGVCIKTKDKTVSFSDSTTVRFKKLTLAEIDYYVTTSKPLDKAGAYGIQEWIGMIGIEQITGSYYTVMGLPVHKLHQLLQTQFAFN